MWSMILILPYETGAFVKSRFLISTLPGLFVLFVLSFAQAQKSPLDSHHGIGADTCSNMCSEVCSAKVENMKALIGDYESRCGNSDVPSAQLACTPGKTNTHLFYIRNLETQEVRHDTGFNSLKECAMALKARRADFVCTRGNNNHEIFFIRNVNTKAVAHETGFRDLDECTTSMIYKSGNIACTRGNSNTDQFFLRDLTTMKAVSDSGYADLKSCVTSIGFVQ
jgi:hypothetical protein